MAEEIKAYRQYIYKNGQFRKTSGGGGAEIRVVDTLPELGEPNVLYVLDDGTSQPSSKGAVVEDTITIKEMKLVPSVVARKITPINGVAMWVPDPVLFIRTNYISDNIYNKILNSNTVVLKLNKLTRKTPHRKAWRGARFTCRDNFYLYDKAQNTSVYIGDTNRDLWIKYHIIPILPSMIKENEYGKYVEVSINLLERSLLQLKDLNSENNPTAVDGRYDYTRNPQLSPAKISKLLSFGRESFKLVNVDQVQNEQDIYIRTVNEQFNSSISSFEHDPENNKILHTFRTFPTWKLFKETAKSMPTWHYTFKGTGNFIPVDSSYRYALDFRTRFKYLPGTIDQYKEIAVNTWETSGHKSFPTVAITPEDKPVIAAPSMTTIDSDGKKLAEDPKFVRELIQPSFGILADNWLDINCKHIWKKKFKNPDSYISIVPREMAYILNEPNYPVECWFDITYKICKFN